MKDVNGRYRRNWTVLTLTMKPVKLKQKHLPPVMVYPSTCDLYLAGEIMFGEKPSHPPVENADTKRRAIQSSEQKNR